MQSKSSWRKSDKGYQLLTLCDAMYYSPSGTLNLGTNQSITYWRASNSILICADQNWRYPIINYQTYRRHLMKIYKKITKHMELLDYLNVNLNYNRASSKDSKCPCGDRLCRKYCTFLRWGVRYEKQNVLGIAKVIWKHVWGITFLK